MNGLDSAKEEINNLGIDKNICIFIVDGYLDKSYGAEYSFSQEGEDIIISNLFKRLRKTEISYCDIGANDPIKLNNTYLLRDKFKIKKGVLVEPNPTAFEKLRRIRPMDICLNVGICGDKKADQNSLKFYIMSADTLSTFSLESMMEYQRFGYKVKQEIDIECVGINCLFEEYFGDDGIDFLDIDVEGMDFEIVSGIDFEKYRPLAICVETSGYYMGKDTDGLMIIEYLLSKGYIVYADTFLNTIFVLKTEMEKYCENIKTIRG